MNIYLLWVELGLAFAVQIYLIIGFYFMVRYTPKEPLEVWDLTVHLFKLLFYWPWARNK